MVILSSSNVPLSISVISHITKSSPHHIAKVLQKLAQGRLVYSKPGPKGGFSINKSNQSISLFDIYECVEGTKRLENILELRKKTVQLQPIDQLSIEISNHFISFLKRHNLAMYSVRELIPELIS